jgi:hypothetical protein
MLELELLLLVRVEELPLLRVLELELILLVRVEELLLELLLRESPTALVER